MISERDAVKGKTLVSVAAVIEGEEHKILLIWEGDLPYRKSWVVPGGYVKPDETVKQAIIREVREETGLEILPAKFVGLYDDFLSKKDEPIHHIIVAYEAIVIEGRLVVNVLLFRLASEKLIVHQASPGTIYHIDQYELATKLLKNKFVKIFRNANIREIPYDIREKDGDWVRVNARKGTWVGSFGSGFIEKWK